MTLKEKFSDKLDIDQRKIDLLKEFASVCKRNRIRVILIESPIYYPYTTMTNRDRIVEGLIIKTAKELDVPFIPLTQDICPVFRDSRLFKDVLHLNRKGSKIFSGMVSEKVLEFVPKTISFEGVDLK
jgi:lysophospholipase L1-like esterase